MPKIAKLIALSCCAVVALSALPAGAATPGGATMSKTKKSLGWTGASSTFSSAPFDPIGIGNDCNLLGDPFCDHFSLKIDLGEGAKIQIQIKGSDPASATDPTKPYNDFDVFVYPPGAAAAPIVIGGSPSGNETVTFVHKARWRKQPYDIAVRPYLVMPGATYKGAAKAVTLGAK
jgi:hypothetical protein